jgi:uncharacterized hydrophobic protein (TIGR00271 family)
MADADASTGPAPAPHHPPRPLRKLKAWHRRTIVSEVDHPTVLERVHGDSRWSGRYAFMIAMSAGIAILGLLLASPAVIIGAMLISPLMGPIIGLGFALATFDWHEVRASLLALLAGTVLAVAFTAGIVLLSPLQDITPEILARTRPNLFDLLVAVFSALAGGYATVRGRGETIVGVAIATALMPPLAVVGFGLATGNSLIFTGAFTLFLTNFIAISLSATLIARFYGFGSDLSPRQSRAQAMALLLVLAALAIPLGLALKQIAWEAWATRTARRAVQAEFGEASRIASLDPTFGGSRVTIRATVFTDRLHDKADPDLERRLSASLGVPVSLQLSQILVNQGGGQRAALERAQATAATTAQDERLARADMAARLALVANVPVEAVTVDPVSRIASARAEPGRSLVDMMQSEARLREDSPGWTVRILPPAGPLPDLPVPADGLTEADAPALDAMAWALAGHGTNSARVTPRRLSREPLARAIARGQAVAAALESRGILVEIAPPSAADAGLERDSGLDAARSVRIEALAPVAPPPVPEQATERPVAAG